MNHPTNQQREAKIINMTFLRQEITFSRSSPTCCVGCRYSFWCRLCWCCGG